MRYKCSTSFIITIEMFLFFIVLAGCLEIILITMKDESAKIGIFCHTYTASYKKPSAPGDGTLLLIMIKSNLKLVFNLT